MVMLVPRAKQLEEVILKLLAIEHEVSIRSIARFAGLSEVDDADRKAIRRAIISLEAQQLVTPKGAGRSRVYVVGTRSH